MNLLNSILLEGKIIDVDNQGFAIEFGELKVEGMELFGKFTQSVNVRTKIKNENIKKNRNVRIVGKLEQNPSGFCLVAEHIEFKSE